MIRRSEIWKNIDWITIIVYLCLVLFGWLIIYSASYNDMATNIFDVDQEYGKQFIWIIASCLLGIFVLIIDYVIITRFAFETYGLIMILLVAVLIFGKEINGAKSWFAIGGVGIQPSEFAKFATTLALSKYLTEPNVKMDNFKTKVIAFALIAFPAALILMQPDTGTVLVFIGFVFMMYREGLSGNILLFGLLSIILAIGTLLTNASSIEIPFVGYQLKGVYTVLVFIFLLGGVLLFATQKLMLPRFRKKVMVQIIGFTIACMAFTSTVNYAFNDVLSPHQQVRINILLGLEQDPQGAGYNVLQSKTSIGSGGFLGKGYLNGTLTKFKYVPMQSTDFIFCTVGEEFGFFGSLIVVSLFLILILRIILLAERQRSSFARIFGYSTASIFFIHLAINIGMAVGLAPVIGIPLPFFSYGGSSLFGFTFLLFVFLKLDTERLSVLR
jgi:rod shape determining protein RodA